MERKVKTLTRNWRDHRRTGTHKHTETVSRYFDWHGHLSQSEECKWHLLSSDWERRPCHLKYLDTVSVCLCVPVLLWSLQFLERVFTFLSLNLWFSYFGILFSTWLELEWLGMHVYAWLKRSLRCTVHQDLHISLQFVQYPNRCLLC